MFSTRSLITMLCLLSTACTTPARENITVFTHESMKTCVTAGMQSIQDDPSSAKTQIDRKYVRQEIADAFGVDDVFLFFNQGAIKRTFKDLSSRVGDGSLDSITIEGFRNEYSPDTGYILFGRIGDEKVELNARFYNDGTCKLLNIRYDGINFMSVYIGLLSSEPAFARQIEIDLDDF